MNELTIHDILGTIEGLHGFATQCASAARSKVYDVKGVTGILVNPVVLATLSTWMTEAAKELQRLIPNGPIAAPKGVARRERTLVRVVAYDAKSGALRAVLPGWNADVVVDIVVDASTDMGRVLRNDLPCEAYPCRVYAWVNLTALNATELKFSDWELPLNGE